MMNWPRGKYKGQPLNVAPHDYIRWVLGTWDFTDRAHLRLQLEGVIGGSTVAPTTAAPQTGPVNPEVARLRAQVLSLNFQLEQARQRDKDKRIAELEKELDEIQEENRTLRRAQAAAALNQGGLNGKTDGVKKLWRELFRPLAMRVHPDRGGDHELMAALNRLNDMLK